MEVVLRQRIRQRKESSDERLRGHVFQFKVGVVCSRPVEQVDALALVVRTFIREPMRKMESRPAYSDKSATRVHRTNEIDARLDISQAQAPFRRDSENRRRIGVDRDGQDVVSLSEDDALCGEKQSLVNRGSELLERCTRVGMRKAFVVLQTNDRGRLVPDQLGDPVRRVSSDVETLNAIEETEQNLCKRDKQKRSDWRPLTAPLTRFLGLEVQAMQRERIRSKI